MTKDVLIRISGLHMGEAQVDDERLDEDGPIEVLVPGTYYLKNGKRYLFFEERVEGCPDAIKSQIKWSGSDCLEVTKKGVTNMNMVYECNKKTQCFYNTPYGRLDLGIFTKEIALEESEDNIDIRVEYSMEANGQYIGECRILINIKSKGLKNFTIFDM